MGKIREIRIFIITFIFTLSISLLSSFLLVQGLSLYMASIFPDLVEPLSYSLLVSFTIVFIAVVFYVYNSAVIRFGVAFRILGVALIAYSIMVSIVFISNTTGIHEGIIYTLIYLIIPIGIGFAIYCIAVKVENLK